MAKYTAAEGATVSYGTGTTTANVTNLRSFSLSGYEIEAVAIPHIEAGSKLHRPSQQVELGEAQVVLNYDGTEHSGLLTHIAAKTVSTWTFVVGTTTVAANSGFITSKEFGDVGEGSTNVGLTFNVKFTGALS